MSAGSPSVLHLLWSGEIGGAERAVFQLTKEQLRQGMKVAVAFGQATGLYADSLRKLGCPIVSLDASGGNDLRVLPRAMNAFGAFDIHHFHGIEPLTFLASLLSGPRTRVFTQRAGVTQASPRKRIRRLLVKHALQKRFHGWCGNSAHARETLSNSFDIAPGAIDVVPNGIDFDLLRPQADRNEWRSSLGIAKNDFVIGTTAILKSWKRVHLLLEAAGLLDRSDLRVLIVGDGPDRARLEATAHDLGIEDLTIFTGMEDRVVEFVCAMDVFVLPSGKAETFGNSVVEAMALGIPSAVFSDSPGLCAHIDTGKTGFVVESVEGLRSVLNRLRSDAELRATVGSAGAEHVRSSYGIHRTAEGYAAAYAKALTRRSQTAIH